MMEPSISRPPVPTPLARRAGGTATVLLLAAALAGCDGSTFLTNGPKAGEPLPPNPRWPPTTPTVRPGP
jgi:hypothetical protein